MTCQDLHTYFDSQERADSKLLPHPEVAEHIAGCPHCIRFVEEQEELRKHVRLVRDSAPPIRSPLDDAVLANYRSSVLERSSRAKATSLIRRIDLRTALGWAAAVAFAAVVAGAGILLFDPQQPIPQQQASQEIVARQPAILPAQRTDGLHRPSPKTPKSRRSSNRGRNNPELAAEQNALLPTEFESLMYCDQISCPGALEVIRVQLSSSMLGVTPPSGRTDSAVFADILVGPDGIARGIRVVE
jgi:hypothetical protein